MRYLTFALGKGRLAKKTLELFEKIGITCEEMKDKEIRVSVKAGEGGRYSDPYRRKRSQRRSKSSSAMRSIRKRFYWMHR